MQNKYFVFAIKTLYTIEMNLMYRKNQKLQLYNFVGGRIWSFNKQKSMVRAGVRRATFRFEIEKGFQYCYSFMVGNGKEKFCKILDVILKLPLKQPIDIQKPSEESNIKIDIQDEQDALLCYILIGFMCRFRKKQGVMFEENLKGFPIMSKNSTLLKEARFNLDAIIVSCIDLELQSENISLDRYPNTQLKEKAVNQFNEYVQELVTIPINVDLIDACYNKCKESKDIKTAANDSDYYDNYLSSINKVFEELNSYLVVEQRKGIDDKLKQLLIGIYCALIDCFKNTDQESEPVKQEGAINIEKLNIANINNYETFQRFLLRYISKNSSIRNESHIKKQFDVIDKMVSDEVDRCTISNQKQDMSTEVREEIKKEIAKLNGLINTYNHRNFIKGE